MKRNKMFVVGILAATFLLVPTGLWAQREGDSQRKGDHCSRDQRENCLLGTFIETVHTANGMTLRALATFSPGGGLVETNTAQGAPVTVHASWAATKDGQFELTFITFPLVSGIFAVAKTKETVTLSDSGDSFTAVFVVEAMDANGNVIATLPGTANGKRIPVEPLNN
jgi:hypothetical protein